MQALSPPAWPRGVLFAVAAWLLGVAPGAAVFTLNHRAADDIGLTAVPVPAWVFIAVWMVIYPCMGIAAWQLWTQRSERAADAFVPLAVLVAGFLQVHLFWFTDSLRSTAIADATGMLLAATTLWVFSRYSRTAARWLLPWAIWMPVTLAIKIAVITGTL
jgi:tryptophan-rich sensory protein